MEEEEQDPSEEYLKAYNDGYQMARHEPKLLAEILKSQDSDHHYITIMAQGKDQFEHEKLMDEMKSIREKQNIKPRRMK